MEGESNRGRGGERVIGGEEVRWREGEGREDGNRGRGGWRGEGNRGRGGEVEGGGG